MLNPKVDRPEGRRPRTHVANLASTPLAPLLVGAFGVLSDLGDRGVF